MTIDTSTIDGKLAVMQAFKDGAKIEVADRYAAEKIWKSCLGIPSWNWTQCDFRIKPREPREFTIIMDSFDGTIFSALSGWNHRHESRYKLVKVREVLE